MSYPKCLYNADGHVIVQSSEEEEALEGYFDNPWEPKGEDRDGNKLDAVDTKEDLIEKAKSLGIDVKGTWGVRKLQEAIAEAEKAE